MNRFEYEYEVLDKLNKLLKIESINKINDVIRLNFANDFRYEFNRKILEEAYVYGYPADFISRQIKEDVRSQFVDTFVERKRLERESLKN